MAAVWENVWGYQETFAGHYKHCWLLTSGIVKFQPDKAVYHVPLIQK